MSPPAFSIGDVARASAWWTKLAPVLGTAYAVACLHGHPVWSLGPELALLLASLVNGATYVGLVNDLADEDADRVAGKPNRLAGRSTAVRLAMFGPCLVAGVGAAWLLGHRDPVAAWMYAGAWVSFSLYSLPPFRAKERGFAGVLADAAGAHAFPQLLAVSLVSHAVGVAADPRLLAAVGAWALACGARGNLWHQLGDRTSDQRAAQRTYASSRDPAEIERLVRRVILPGEVASFSVFLVLTHAWLAATLLVGHTLLELRLAQRDPRRLTVVDPGRGRRILFFPFYEQVFPIATLLLSPIGQPADALLVPIHLALFPRSWRTALSALRGAGRQPASGVSARIPPPDPPARAS